MVYINKKGKQIRQIDKILELTESFRSRPTGGQIISMDPSAVQSRTLDAVSLGEVLDALNKDERIIKVIEIKDGEVKPRYIRKGKILDRP